jgi:Ca2+-binding RTX toxin-like protein
MSVFRIKIAGGVLTINPDGPEYLSYKTSDGLIVTNLGATVPSPSGNSSITLNRSGSVGFDFEISTPYGTISGGFTTQSAPSGNGQVLESATLNYTTPHKLYLTGTATLTRETNGTYSATDTLKLKVGTYTLPGCDYSGSLGNIDASSLVDPWAEVSPLLHAALHNPYFNGDVWKQQIDSHIDDSSSAADVLGGFFISSASASEMTNQTPPTGTGMIIPGQAHVAGENYYLANNGDGSFALLFDNGAAFGYSDTFQQWSVPDSNADGGITVYTRNVTGGIAYGDWTVQQIAASGVVTSTTTLTGTIPSESLTLTTDSTNPFITGKGVTSSLPNSANLTPAQAIALAEATGTAITFNDQSATVTTGNCYTCTIDLSAASGSDQTITLTLTGGANNMVVDGNTKEFINFSGGNATITVPAGQDSVTLTLIDGNNVSTADKLNLTATLTPSAGSGQAITSNALAITFNDPNPNAGSSTPPANTINGDLTPINFGTAGSPSYHRDAYGNLINNGTPDPNFSDYLYGDGGNDVVNAGGGDNVVAGMGGNDTINAGTGNDVIVGGSIYASNESYVPEPTSVGTGPVSGQFYQNYGGNGNNVINGGGGQDIIIVGNGNNQIYANTQLTLADALDQQDTATASGQKGDLIAVGDGNNTIVGGAGNDAIFALTGGSGSDVLQGGSGNTLFVAGSDTISLFVRDRCKAANDFEWMMAA